MKRLNRGFFVGLSCGIGASVIGAIALGAGRAGIAGDLFVTSGGDGRHAYLWRGGDGGLEFVGSAVADKGSGDDAKDKGKDDSEEKGKPDDKGKPDGKGKPDDKSKPDDKGKGKGKGGG